MKLQIILKILYTVFILYFHMFNNINKLIDYLLFVGMLKKLMAKQKELFQRKKLLLYIYSI